MTIRHRSASTKTLFAALLFAVPFLILPVWSAGQQQWGPAGSPPDSKWTPVKSIDFSAQHNVLIRNEDGSTTPMDVPWYRSTQIAPGTWQILSDGDYSYLLEGDNEALAIDSTYGAGNIREYMQTLTKKPVRYVANTHEHFDHTANNSYFDRAYMSKEARERATIPYPSFAGIQFPRNYPIQVVGDGYKFQLGNREVEVFEIANHTTGDLGFLDKRERFLFSGDVFMRTININPASSVARFAANMRKLKAHRSEFDRLAAGIGLSDASYIDQLLANAEYILAGHEGEPASNQQGRGPGQGRGPAPAADEAKGVVIYSRKSVRPPDRPQQPPPSLENIRKMTYTDCTITYDVRHINN